MANVTYVTYNQGIDAKRLHLGNLVHDFKNPSLYEPYIDKAYTDIAEPPPAWARSRALENFALTLGEDSNTDDSDDDEGGQRYRVVAAAKTTQIEIKDTEEFFNEVTLKSEKAKLWLASHISAAEDLHPKAKPQIWMLTGLILMTHATWTSLSSKQTFTPGLQAPFDPTGVTAIRRSSVSDHVRPVFGYEEKEDTKHIPGAVIHETGKYPGTRGWAARWERVDVQIQPAEKWQAGVDNQLMLHVPNSSPKIAVVELNEEEYARNEDEGAVEDDEYWEKFIDVIDEYE